MAWVAVGSLRGVRPLGVWDANISASVKTRFCDGVPFGVCVASCSAADTLGGGAIYGCAEGRSFDDCVANCCSADIGGLLRGVGLFGV